MSYTPTNWKSGDVVTSAKLNKLEQGVADTGGGALVVTLTSTVADEQEIWSTDKTAGEIFAALPNVVLLETKRGLTAVRPIITFAAVDGIGYEVQYFEVGYTQQANFTARYLFATSADAIMTTEEPEEPSGPPAE